MIDQRVIDVRQRFEFVRAHIEGSEHVPLATLTNACQDWPRDQPLLLVCRSGHRAQLAQRRLAELGFQHLEVLRGGIELWSSQGKPLAHISDAPRSLSQKLALFTGLLVPLSLILAFTLSHLFFIATAIAALSFIALRGSSR